MDYLISFLEGIITFISPCLLPMLPIYISYFAGRSNDKDKKSTLSNAIAFVLGFTFVFCLALSQVMSAAFLRNTGPLSMWYQEQSSSCSV